MISTLSMISSPKLSGKHFPSTHSMRQPPTRNASRSCLILVPSGSLHICNFGVNPILEKSVKKTCTVAPAYPLGIANSNSPAKSSCISQRSLLSVMQPKNTSSILIRYMKDWPWYQLLWLTAYSLDSQRRQEPQQSQCYWSSVLIHVCSVNLADSFSLIPQPSSHECNQNISSNEPFCTLS